MMMQCSAVWTVDAVVSDFYICHLSFSSDAIFIVRQMQEKFRAKRRKLYFGFVDLEKVFDRAHVD